MIHVSGLILISIALCFDAAIGNLQEKFMRKSQAANAEVVGKRNIHKF